MANRRLAGAFVATIVVCSVVTTKAESEEMSVIVMVKNDEIVFDKGSEHGVGKGDKVRIYRKVIIRHPVTKAEIVDRFLIGEAKVYEAGLLLSIIKPKKDFLKKPEIGDLIELIRKGDRGKPPKAKTVKPEKQQEPAGVPPTIEKSDPEKEALLEAFDKGLGKSWAVRQELYFEFLLKYPDGRFSKAVGTEVAWLKEQEKREKVVPRRKTEVKKAQQMRVYRSRVKAIESPLSMESARK